MSKEEKETIVDNPFKNFNLLSNPEPIKAEPNDKGAEGEISGSKETSGNKKDETLEDKKRKEAQAKSDKLLQDQLDIIKNLEKDKKKPEVDDNEVDKKLEETAKKQAAALEKAKKKEAGLEDDSEEEQEEDVEEEKEQEEDNSLKPFVEALNEKGIVKVDLSEFKDEDFKDEEVLDKVIGKTIEKGIEDWKNSYPEETKAFLDFVENGGDPKQFLDIYYGNYSWEDFKPENETAQKVAIRQGLKLAGWEDAEIEDEIQLYEDSGKLEAKANQHLNKLKKYESEAKENLVKQQETARIEHEKKAKEYYDNLQKTWYDKDDLNGFKLNKVTKDKVWDFIYKVDKKSGKTGLQASYENNQDAQFMYAYLAMNNFDISKLEKIVESKVTSKVRKSLSNYTDQRFKTTKGSSEREDKVTENGPGFDAFRRIM